MTEAGILAPVNGTQLEDAQAEFADQNSANSVASPVVGDLSGTPRTLLRE